MKPSISVSVFFLAYFMLGAASILFFIGTPKASRAIPASTVTQAQALPKINWGEGIEADLSRSDADSR